MCAIDLFSKYEWVVPLEDKRGVTIVKAFQKIISKGRKPNKIWVDWGSESYNKLFKKFLKKITLKCIQHTVKENLLLLKDLFGHWKTRFLSTWQLFQKMFDVLDNVANKYNNAVHRTIKMKPIDLTSDSYAEYNEDSNEKDPKFKVGDRVRISKYKNIIAKGYKQNWSEEINILSFLSLAKLKIQFRGHTRLETWMVDLILQVFMKRIVKNKSKRIHNSKST